MASLFAKDLFFGLDNGTAHLCTGGEAPMLRAAEPALAEFCALKSTGMPGRDRFYECYAEVKGLLAQLLGGVNPADIAFLANASDGLNTLARSIAWRPGDEVITLAGEFPSSIFPWLVQRAKGVTVRVLDPGPDPESAISAAITDRTRVICVSHVNYFSGLRVDLERLSGIARSCGAILAVDASHSLGVLPVPAQHVDFLFSCCYKFLLATHGVGVCYWNRNRIPDLPESALGWHSTAWPTMEERKSSYRPADGAARLELGNPSFITLYVLRTSLRLLTSVDPGVLEGHVLALGMDLLTGLREMGLPILTPQEPARRGPNVAFSASDDARLVTALAAEKVLAWGGDDRVRFSVHGYNDRKDVAQALEAVREVVRG